MNETLLGIINRLAEALEPFATLSIPEKIPDDVWTSCDTYDQAMSEDEYDNLVKRGIPLLGKMHSYTLWIDGISVGDFRKAKAALDELRKMRVTE